MNDTIWRIDAAGAADGERCSHAPASLLIATTSNPNRDRQGAALTTLPTAPSLAIPPESNPSASKLNPVAPIPTTPYSCHLLALDNPAEINRHPAAAAVPPERHLTLPTSIITPALVNAHTHLDLTHIGPRPYDPSSGFVGWAMSLVRPNRAATLEAATASLREGIRRSLLGGVVAVGDIIGAIPNHTGDQDPRATLAHELRNTFGQSAAAFAEVFGFGPSQHRAIAELEALAAAGCDLQPHAPYSVAPSVYHHAAQLARKSPNPPRLCTHLAETLDERRFIQQGDGPFRGLLERIGLWNAEAAADIGQGMHPIEHVIRLGMTNFLAAHVNDCPTHLIPQLQHHHIAVAYCPRAHAYFHHPTTTGPHKYREMLEANVNVCLATDSIINIPPDQSDRISPLDDARLLFERDQTDATTLLAMITTRGATALALDPTLFTLTPSSSGAPKPLAGLLAIDIAATPDSDTPARRVMQSRANPILLNWHTQQRP